ncbi:cyanophycinase [Pirellulaceae bacterium SH449]
MWISSGLVCRADDAFTLPIVSPEGIVGKLLIGGGGRLPDSVIKSFVQNVPEPKNVVVIGTASKEPHQAEKSAMEWLAENGLTNFNAAHQDDATPIDLEDLAKSIDQCQAIWISGGVQSRLADAYAGTMVESSMQGLLKRGGIIGGSSAGAAIMSRAMIASGREKPVMSTGLDLLPGSILDQHFTERSRLSRLQAAVAQNPGLVGIGIDEQTALFVEGRSMRVLGNGAVTLVLGKCSYREETVRRVEPGPRLDLVQWLRAAETRKSDCDPGIPLGTPEVSNGALVIVGGGGMPRSVVNEMIELSGGDKAHWVVLPTAVPKAQVRASVPSFLQRRQVASIEVLTQTGPDEVNTPEFQTALEKATGVWFDGGRQWNFVDAYAGTNALELFHKVLERGGVIGGSSAGATIQGEFLVRGHPLGNTVMMAEGYERGFGFLPGVAIDQHFAQRNRFPDLVPVVRTHPKLVGIGIDESTALVVRGHTAKVIGDSAVHIVTSDMPGGEESTDWKSYYKTYRTGESFDLKASY